MLTRRQKEALNFIIAHSDEHGSSPTLQQIADHLGNVSRGNGHRIVSALVKRGWIKRLPNHANGLEVIRRPGEPSAEAVAHEPAFGWLDPAARRPGVIVIHVNAQGKEQAVHVFPDLASAADGLSRMP